MRQIILTAVLWVPLTSAEPRPSTTHVPPDDRIATVARAPEAAIRFQPGDVIAYREAAGRDFYSLMVHNVAVLNEGDAPLELSSVRFEAVHGERVSGSTSIGREHLAASAATMNSYQQAGVLDLYDFYFQTSTMLPGGTTLSPSPALGPGEALIVSQTPMLVRGVPDLLRVSVEWEGPDGSMRSESRDLPVAEHVTPNAYVFPVVGVWYNAAGAGLRTHHRWVSNEEFALDLAIIGSGGRSRRGEADLPSDFFAYGEDVLAIADGDVVRVEGGMPETLGMFPREGESAEDFEARIAEMQMGFLRQSIYAALGNHVTLRHANGEFSHYVHLAENSVSLAVGDRVSQGQVIGKVGHSGNSTEPHLHFQLTDGPDPLYSRGLPIVFTNATELFDRVADVSPASGWFIEATPPDDRH